MVLVFLWETPKSILQFSFWKWNILFLKLFYLFSSFQKLIPDVKIDAAALEEAAEYDEKVDAEIGKLGTAISVEEVDEEVTMDDENKEDGEDKDISESEALFFSSNIRFLKLRTYLKFRLQDLLFTYYSFWFIIFCVIVTCL